MTQLSKRVVRKMRRQLRHKFMNHRARLRMVRTIGEPKYGSAYFYARMAWDRSQADAAAITRRLLCK